MLKKLNGVTTVVLLLAGTVLASELYEVENFLSESYRDESSETAKSSKAFSDETCDAQLNIFKEALTAREDWALKCKPSKCSIQFLNFNDFLSKYLTCGENFNLDTLKVT